MGEYADLILDGEVCAVCHCALPGTGDGSPRCCRDCALDETQETALVTKPKAPTVRCPTCWKKVKVAGLADHTRDRHGPAVPAVFVPPTGAPE